MPVTIVPARLRAWLGAFACVWAPAAAAVPYHWNPDPALDSGQASANSAHNWTSNADGSGSWPPSPLDEDFDSGAPAPAWTLKDATGDAAHPASREMAGGALRLTARAGDLDAGTYAALRRSDRVGDFDVAVRVGPVSGTAPKAGILLMNDFDNPSSGGACAFFRGPGGGLYARFDLQAPYGVPDLPDASPATMVPLDSSLWLRAARKGTTFYGFYRRSTAEPWTLFAHGTSHAVAASSQIGLFASAGTDTAAAIFDDFRGGGAEAIPDGLELRFDGTSAGKRLDAVLMADLAVARFDMTGFEGFFNFGAHTLTVLGDAVFQSVNPAQGTLMCLGGDLTTGSPTTALPDLRKRGSGALTLRGYALDVQHLDLEQGTLALGALSASATALTTASGTVLKQDAGSYLTIRGNADFTGAAASTLGGSVYVVAQADSSGAQGAVFTPAACAFHDLRLEAAPRYGNAATLSVAGDASHPLKVSGNLVFSDGSSGATAEGAIEFTGPFRAEIAGNVQMAHPGGGSPDLVLRLGAGVFALGGGLDLALAKRVEPGTSSLSLAAGAHALRLSDGSRDNGSLGRIQVTGGDVALGSALKATAYAQSGGSLSLAGGNLSAVGDLSLDAAGGALALTGLGGRELSAGHDLSMSGSAGSRLDLAAGQAWTAYAGHSLTAAHAVLANSRATGSPGVADPDCRDGGGNQSWSFPSPPATCDTAFAVAADSLVVDEGHAFALGGTATCAEDHRWEALAGPAPADPAALAPVLAAPRVEADSLLAYRFSAHFADGWHSRDVRVRVREAIPDPLFALSAPASWTGSGPLVLHPRLLNAAALAAAPEHPALSFAWILAGPACDTAGSADSLALASPRADGELAVTYCADNGGESHCALSRIQIGRATGITGKAFAFGPAALRPGSVFWNGDGEVRVWGWEGRLLWSARGRAGGETAIPPQVERAWRQGRARLDIRTGMPARR